VKKKYIFCFDIDNVICKTTGRNYSKATPDKEAIKIINNLFRAGHKIKIFTARYMGRNNDNIIKAHKAGYKKTLTQLKKWNLNFHNLILGKPTFDIFVDDKAYGYKKNWKNKLKKYYK
jgi:CMP-N,N'-diacetyllegionaminic acid synthase